MAKKIEEKPLSEEQKKIKDLKIELLKNTLKRKQVKKEIARLLTKKSRTILETREVKTKT